MLRVVLSGLKTRLYEIQGVADYDACCAGDVAGPEICGHVWRRGGLTGCLEGYIGDGCGADASFNTRGSMFDTGD
jgi:hypothetical protein